MEQNSIQFSHVHVYSSNANNIEKDVIKYIMKYCDNHIPTNNLFNKNSPGKIKYFQFYILSIVIPSFNFDLIADCKNLFLENSFNDSTLSLLK